ncbi:antirestriction protein [Salmonella enterica]|nr:antirestriction protein [Salmonella enterica]
MNNEVIVTARKLTDYEERLMFMPKFFGQYWHFVENNTYNWMRKYFDGLLTAEAAGMVATSFVLAQLANSNLPFSERCSAYYHQLFDYASGHQEYAQFRAAIN